MSMRYPGGLIATSPVNAAYPSGVWTQAQAIPYQSQNVWTRDQYWPYTTLLLQGNGTNGAQNNTFLDSSTNNFTITRNGNTTQGSFTPYEANWSVNFGASSTDWIATPSSASFAFGTGDFTLEAFVFATASQTDNWIIGLYNNCWLRVGSGGALEFYNSVGSASIIAGSAMPTNQWVHVAAVRSGTTLTIYQNGTSVASGTVSTNFSTSVACIVGNQGGGFDRRWNGYISNVRVVKGTAVYTSAFTPSTTNLTAITNTVLLTCQNNRYIDNSSNAFALTVSGSPSVQAFQPFPGQTTYSTSVLGGSGYFDGSGDFLATPSNAAFTLGSSGDFTVECWIYPIGTQSLYSTVVSTYTDFNSGGGYLNKWHLGYSTTTTLTWYDSAGNAGVSSTNHPINSWSHVAVVRSGSNITMYVNGASIGTQTTNQSYTSQSPVQVGFVTNAAYFNGYISNVRVVKGSAVYTSNFTPPTAPLTAIANTSLLLSTTNAGISDAAMMNDLETVGNAQVSTSVVKYGTGSMAFDGSGDYLFAPNNLGQRIMGGDFTVEMWMYLGAAQANMGLVSSYENNNGWLIRLDTTYIRFFYGTGGSGTANDVTYSFTPGVWYHIAWVKSGTSLRCYINGTQQGSTFTISGATDTTTAGMQVGRTQTTSNDLNGYIDDLRITKGAARYISSFTPPPARMPGQ